MIEHYGCLVTRQTLEATARVMGPCSASAQILKELSEDDLVWQTPNGGLTIFRPASQAMSHRVFWDVEPSHHEEETP